MHREDACDKIRFTPSKKAIVMYVGICGLKAEEQAWLLEALCCSEMPLYTRLRPINGNVNKTYTDGFS